jgi:hypothetical protein
MAYKRRTSQVLVAAQERSTNLKAIDPNFALSEGLSVASLDSLIERTQASLDAYNTLLAQADAAGNNVINDEKEMRDMSTRLLAGVGAHYGKDSNEYEMAGGTRTSEITSHPHTPTEEGEGNS